MKETPYITNETDSEASPGEAAADALRELCGKVRDDVRARQSWLTRQTVWYEMRHTGIRRLNKPWPSAADQHYPLVDSIIDKLKPFYFNQLFGTETVAQFIAREPELTPYAEDVGYWFDYKLKQSSNLEAELLILIDKMLMAGHGVCKVYWQPGRDPVEEKEDAGQEEPREGDAETSPGGRGSGEEGDASSRLGGEDDVTPSPGAGGAEPAPGSPALAGDRGALRFDAIEPLHCIVPDYTQSLDEADRVTIVHHLSVEQYKRDPRWTHKDEDFIKRITGRGAGEAGDSEQLEQTKEIREGITHTDRQQNTIIVWEIWRQDSEGWMVHWVSPLAEDEPLRPTQRNPFRHGKLPIVRFDCEVKDKGHYASRGVPEKASPFEQALNNYWNEKSDYMTLCNRPLFTSSIPIPNAANLRLLPGQIVPGGLSAVQMPPPPVSFDQEMQQTRSVAEYHIGMPDFGLGSQTDLGEARTATEVQKISGLMGVSVDLRARTFRMSLGKLLRLAWFTLVQYDEETEFFVDGELKQLQSPALRAEAWLIQPNGSSETWNKQAQMQKAVMRKQLFAQSPWINQPELDKSILELDDPRLVKRLFIDPQQKQQSDYEDEATKIPTLLLGLPLAPQAEDDQAMRIKCLLDFLHQRQTMAAPLDPLATHAIAARIQGHLAQLAQRDPRRARALGQAVSAMLSQRPVGPSKISSAVGGSVAPAPGTMSGPAPRAAGGPLPGQTAARSA